MEIVLVGLNFRTAPVEVRERVSFSIDQAQRAAEELRAQGILEETLVLSTCNRSEVYGVHSSTNRESAGALGSFLSSFHAVQPDVLNSSLYHHYDHDAVRHLFRVSAGLESMLLGEAEILGQVREAYLRAQQGHVTGPVLNRLFQAALEVGKRVRSETDLGARANGRGFRRYKTCRTHLRKAEGANRPRVGSRYHQRASRLPVARPRDR